MSCKDHGFWSQTDLGGSPLHHIPAVWLQATYLTSLSVSCHIFKVGIIIPFRIVAMRTLTDNVCVEQCLAYRGGSAQTLEWGDLG